MEDILSYIDTHHKLIQVDTKDGKAFDVVRLKRIENSTFILDELMPNAKWRDELRFSSKVFRVICFDNDYLNSLKLITKFPKKLK